MGIRCTDPLLEEHGIILRASDLLTALAERLTSLQPVETQDVAAVIEILRVFGDELHQGKEEAVLFPILTASCDREEVDAVRHLLDEHNRDRLLLDRLHEALRSANLTEFKSLSAQLTQILQDHIYKEDEILFAIVNRTLSESEAARVLSGFESFDRRFEGRGLHRLLHRLRMLEWKYLGRAA